MTSGPAPPAVLTVDVLIIGAGPVGLYGAYYAGFHPAECIDCGACEPACPVEAIRPQQRLPDSWKPFHSNVLELFQAIGSPGGSGKVTGTLPDSAFVRDYIKDYAVNGR
jgi:ferredoxin